MKRMFSAILVTLILLVLAMVPASAAPQAPDAISGVSISNVNDVQFVVSWRTDAVAAASSVVWGTTMPPANIAPGANNTDLHSVTITGELSPNTTYYFVVHSDAMVDDNLGAGYSVTTGPDLLPPAPGDNTIGGFVYLSDGTTPVPNAIVYMEISNSDGGAIVSQKFSAQTDGTGLWSYNLNGLRTPDLAAYFNATGGADWVHIVVQGGLAGTHDQWYQIPAGFGQMPSITLTAPAPTAVSLSGLTATAGGSTLPVALSAAGIMGAAIGIMVVQLRKLTD